MMIKNQNRFRNVCVVALLLCCTGCALQPTLAPFELILPDNADLKRAPYERVAYELSRPESLVCSEVQATCTMSVADYRAYKADRDFLWAMFQNFQLQLEEMTVSHNAAIELVTRRETEILIHEYRIDWLQQQIQQAWFERLLKQIGAVGIGALFGIAIN